MMFGSFMFLTVCMLTSERIWMSRFYRLHFIGLCCMGGYLWLWALRITYQMHKSCEMCVLYLVECVTEQISQQNGCIPMLRVRSILCASTFVLELWTFSQWANNSSVSFVFLRKLNLNEAQLKGWAKQNKVKAKKMNSFPLNKNKTNDRVDILASKSVHNNFCVCRIYKYYWMRWPRFIYTHSKLIVVAKFR